MRTTDAIAKYSIFGSPVSLVHAHGRELVFHAPHRLGPGRTIAVRSGSKTFQATIANAQIVALDAEVGATYELHLELADESAARHFAVPGQLISRAASPAVDSDLSRKGGASRAA